jgi:hypothetical protein
MKPYCNAALRLGQRASVDLFPHFVAKHNIKPLARVE